MNIVINRIEKSTLFVTMKKLGIEEKLSMDLACMVITCNYNLNSYLISLIFMLILCNNDACYLNFMNFLHWYAIILKFIFMHKLGLIMCLFYD